MISFRSHITTEENTYKEFFHQYNQLVFSHIKKKIGNEDDIMDVLQDVFIHLWEYRHSLYSINIENIVFNTCNQKIANFYRNENKSFENESLIANHADTSIQDLISAKKKEKRLKKIEENIELLIPPIRQQIFKMNKLEGITQQQIAVQLNISKRTVKYHIAEAMAFLRDRNKS
ncbi:sigma-70 family RNA polymerase sigma factor [Pedobacter sp. ISL-68]|uniref:sigma-70 family RNA polymerase sigma factor n=1 Tax=unclassified Pedobacter TaxID=2628915 RepID=UPI001BE7F6EC|nr:MULTISPECIES: sigma-70 family RNA polymerase sigma factor [unclassified Pedobacter]MBT2559838.1 sigma-70 family RNA polymerase sigma factor [Pedobacter sp. ISL-64]MBT2592143.1 sigma-70 family RNA polymerase sigma factor [Pedobacter sp. ISL-68]